MKFLSLILGFIFFIACGAEEHTLHKNLNPAPRDNSKAPNLTTSVSDIVIDVVEDHGVYHFTNQSDGLVWYTGYESADAPMFNLEYFDHETERWRLLLAWCGTGLSWYALAPGDTLTIDPSYHYVDTFDLYRTSMSFSDAPSDEAKSLRFTGSEYAL